MFFLIALAVAQASGVGVWSERCSTDNFTDESSCMVIWSSIYDPPGLRDSEVMTASVSEIDDGHALIVASASLIPQRLDVRVDQNEPFSSELCTSRVCVIADADAELLIEQMLAGDGIRIRIVTKSRSTELNELISLDGFSAAFEQLQ